jgi:hypothetical protein
VHFTHSHSLIAVFDRNGYRPGEHSPTHARWLRDLNRPPQAAAEQGVDTAFLPGRCGLKGTIRQRAHEVRCAPFVAVVLSLLTHSLSFFFLSLSLSLSLSVQLPGVRWILQRPESLDAFAQQLLTKWFHTAERAEPQQQSALLIWEMAWMENQPLCESLFQVGDPNHARLPARH